MTGTPLDLTPFGPLLKSVGYVYWLIAFGLAGFALWVPGRWWLKAPIAALILGGFAYPVITHKEVQQQQVDAVKTRLDAAMAHFEMRCKSAGEKISRTVENVEGVVWMKWRPQTGDVDTQFTMDDPFGRDCGEKECIEQLLRASKGQDLDPENKQHARSGYLFVETVDPQTQQLGRYTRHLYRQKERDPKYAEWAIASETVSQPIQQQSARYGITWDDISTREDRELWIAGGSLKVIDLQTNEVIAERTGYMMDREQGSRAGARSPWAYALRNACPGFPSDGTHTTRSWPRTETLIFVSKVLQPITGK